MFEGQLERRLKSKRERSPLHKKVLLSQQLVDGGLHTDKPGPYVTRGETKYGKRVIPAINRAVARELYIDQTVNVVGSVRGTSAEPRVKPG